MRIRPFSTHLLLLVLASTQAARVLYDRTLHHTSSTQKVPVLVGYKRTPGHLFNFTSLQVDLVELESLEQDPDIDFIEVDPVVSLYGEVYTYGPSVVGAYDSQLPSMSGTTADCNDPNSFKIALIDSGMYVNHPDLACSSLNCIGKEFGTALEEGAKWNAPISPHGTLVAGIIGASRDNGLGIRGIVDGQTVCWIVGRVFGDSSPDSFLSPVLEAVQWAVSKGARVMNLSLGGLSYTQTGADLYQDLFDMGLLIVAAAGNKGNSENSYPASYPTVMGVGAVDASLQRAPFSQFNDNVNVVAPGSRIFSTAPILQDQPTRFRQAMLHLDGVTALMLEEFSFTADYTNLTGTLADCGAGTSTCGGGSGNRICVFDYSSNMDLTNCQGVAALVLATDQYPTFPTMQPSNVKIPVFEMTKSAGEALTMGSTVRLEKAWGYLTSDGTSFAAPFVAGTAAAVWQQCPVCTNAEVFECLQKAAVDLGASGKDVEYGHGLVQVDETHTCLVNAGCCREDATPAPTPVPDPTLPPLECSTAESDMKQCLVQADDLCEPCVASYFPANYWLLSCDVYEQNVCDGLRNCVCEPCREEGTSFGIGLVVCRAISLCFLAHLCLFCFVSQSFGTTIVSSRPRATEETVA